jgi:hypothetical protein
VLLEGTEQQGGESEVALHEFFLVLGTVDAGQVEDEVALLAVAVELLGGGVYVVWEDFTHCEGAIALGFAFFDVIELGAKVFAYKAFGTGD